MILFLTGIRSHSRLDRTPHSRLGCVPLAAVVLALLLASCADIFQGKVYMPTGPNNSLNKIFRNNGDGVIKLMPPAHFYVAPYYSPTEIKMSWYEVGGALNYMVERAVAPPGVTPGDSEYEPLDRFVLGTSYIDKILTSPTLESPEYQNVYWYRVSAFNTEDKYDESDPTPAQSTMLFRAPAWVTASGGTSLTNVRVEWELAPGAESYEVWRSVNADGSSAVSRDTVPRNQNWFNDSIVTADQGKDFYYVIVGVKSKDGYFEALPTKPAYGYARAYGSPEAPDKVSLADGSGRGQSLTEIKIVWDKVSDDDAYYAVYRYSEKDSALTPLPVPANMKSSEWTDTYRLEPGVYYYYKVQAILDGASGQMKSELSSHAPEGFLLSCPEEVVAEKDPGGTVTIKWKPAKGNAAEQAAYTYRVYQGNNSSGPFNFTTSSPSISATGLSVAGGAFFRVSTVNGAIESAQSEVVAPPPAAADIVDASQHLFIAGENANVSWGVYPVKITWKKPASENPAFYNVLRSQTAGSGYVRINNAPLPADGTGDAGYSYNSGTGVYTYIDRNESARPGRKYYYIVLSLNELKQGNIPSGEKAGWGGLNHDQYLLQYNKTMGGALKKLTLMYKSNNLDKLGSETKYGPLGGQIYYDARTESVTNARIIIQLTNYAEFHIEDKPENGIYFILNGNSNTFTNMSANGYMYGTVTCTGMYPGRVYYDKIEIKGGAAGGGTYGVEPDGGYERKEISYTVLN